jgi:uncharacterized protein YbaA (DUF1428 family)
MKELMANHEKSGSNEPMPFNPKKMAYGGFRILVNA